MLIEIGFGLVCGSVCSLLSSFSLSSSSSLKSLLFTLQQLKLGVPTTDGLLLPTVNKAIPYEWGTRFLCNLPAGLPSSKVIEQTQAISESMGKEIEIYFKKGLIIDMYNDDLVKSIPYNVIQRNDYKVPIGVNRRGETVYFDFAGSFPHLLIGGISGGGKSVSLRGILTSLVLGPQPDLYLCDMKGGVELGLFKGFQCTKGFAKTLQQCLDLATTVETEMKRRYAIMEANSSQDWHGKKAIFVMDELADLKTRAGDPDKDIKTAIKTKLTNLSAKGRAAGVQLVLATQRPSADVVDGLIKTNIATSICFRTRDAVQSRIVLDHEAAAGLPDIPGRCIFQQAHDETLQTFYLPYDKAKELLKDVERQVTPDASESKATGSKANPLDGNSLELG